MKKYLIVLFLLLGSFLFASSGFSSSYNDPHYAKMINVAQKYLKNKVVTIMMKNNDPLEGKFIDASDFSILIQHENGKLIVIPVFSIKYMIEK